MNEESSVEDEGARCGTQHEWRGWTSRFGRGKASGAARESGRRFGRAGQSLFCLAGKGFEGVEGVGGGAATGESKLEVGMLRWKWRLQLQWCRQARLARIARVNRDRAGGHSEGGERRSSAARFREWQQEQSGRRAAH